ncbi:MAG: transporter substrate-binding domain-containing protein, partial [Desulfuromonadales bacterium]
MKKRSYLLLLTLLFLSLVGSASETLAQKIQVRGDKGFAPFEYLDETGAPAGFDVDILQAVAEVMNLDVELSLGKWEDVRSELEQGQIDALAGMRYSEQRAATVAFSAPYLINTSAIFVRSDSSIQSFEDLRGKEIIIQPGDIMDDYIHDINLTASIVFVDNQTEALTLLASGEHDAVLCSRLRGLYLVSQLKLDNITVVGRELAAGPYGFAVAKGKSELLAHLNEGLRILKATGRYDEIYQRWFGLYEKKTFYWDLFRHAVWVLGPLLLLLGAATTWSWTLKKQVALKTRELGDQFEKRQHAEARLESEKRFRQLIEASPVPIVTIGSDQRLLYINNKFSELFGYTLEEFTDTASWWALACPDPYQRQAVLSAWQDCFDGSDPAPLACEPFEVDVTCQNGSICHVVCRHAAIEGFHVLVFNDITKRKLAETALEERGRIEAMVSAISTRFINLSFDKLGPEIDRALQQIGQQIGFDRCYVFELDANGLTMSNTHEWCAKGIESHLPRLQKVPREDFSWYFQELSEKGFFYCPSVASLGPEAQVEREEWLREDIKSLITVPLLLKGEMVGFIGLDSVKRERSCPQESLFLLRIVGECFANALEHRRVDHKLHSAHQRLQDLSLIH